MNCEAAGGKEGLSAASAGACAWQAVLTCRHGQEVSQGERVEAKRLPQSQKGEGHARALKA